MTAHEPQSSVTTLQTREGGGIVPGDQPSAVALVKEALADAVKMLETHVELAVLEVRQDAKVAVRVGIVLGVASALAFLALSMLLTAAAFALALVLPPWAACLSVGAVVAMVAALFMARGRKRLRGHVFAEQSTRAVEESKRWMDEKLS